MLGEYDGHLSEAEKLAYAAGFLDGEGCFTVINEKNAASIRVTVSNTNKPVLMWFKTMFGGCVAPQYRNAAKLKANHRPVYIWNVDSTNAVGLIQKVLPYLKEKSKQAVLLLSLHQTKQPRGRRKLPEDVRLERVRLCKILKELKHVSH